jgi:hypothetical protein
MEVPRSIVNPPDVKSLRRKARTAGVALWRRDIGTRPPATLNVVVPEQVLVREGFLLWQQSGGTVAKTVEGMLDAFIAIHGDLDVQHFAEQFGALWLCEEHLLPSTHWPEFPMSYDDCEPACVDGWMREPLDRWYEFVARARALLEVVVKLHRDEQPTGEDWCRAAGRAATLPEGSPEELSDFVPPWPPVNESLDDSRWRLCRLVSGWISMGGVTPQLYWWARDSARLLFSPPTVGVLGLQLATAATGYHRLEVCMGCGMMYAPRRKPQAGRDNYCAQCGDGMASKIRHQKRAAELLKRRTTQPRDGCDEPPR